MIYTIIMVDTHVNRNIIQIIIIKEESRISSDMPILMPGSNLPHPWNDNMTISYIKKDYLLIVWEILYGNQCYRGSGSFFHFDSSLVFYCIYYIAMITVECLHSSVVLPQCFIIYHRYCSRIIKYCMV